MAFTRKSTVPAKERRGIPFAEKELGNLTEIMTALRLQNSQDIHSVLQNPLVSKYLLKNQMTLIHLACNMRNVQMVTTLLEQGEDVNIRAGSGSYPIHIVCSNIEHNFVNYRILELLLKHNVNVDVQDSQGRTALMLASCNNLVSMVQLLIQAGCDTNVIDKNGNSALTISCRFASHGWYFWNVDCINDQSGSLEEKNFPCYRISQALLQAGADPKHATLLPSAILYSTEDIVLEFINYGMDVNAMDDNRRTPLGCACSSSHVPLTTVKLLLEHGANVNEDIGRKSKPLVLAFVHNSVEKMKLLLSYGATLSSEEMSELVSLSLTKLFLENPEVIREDSPELLSWKLLNQAGFRPKQELYDLKLKRVYLCSSYPRVGKILDNLLFPMNSLSDLSRKSIRSQLPMPIDGNVNTLPVPNSLKRFLQFEDFSLR